MMALTPVGRFGAPPTDPALRWEQRTRGPVAQHDDRNAAIAGAYLEGATLTDLAEQFGLSRQRIYQILVREQERGRPIVFRHGKPAQPLIRACRVCGGSYRSPGYRVHVAEAHPGLIVRSLNKERKDRIVQAYLAGTKTADIAAREGIHIWSLYRYLRGIPRRQPGKRPR